MSTEHIFDTCITKLDIGSVMHIFKTSQAVRHILTYSIFRVCRYMLPGTTTGRWPNSPPIILGRSPGHGLPQSKLHQEQCSLQLSRTLWHPLILSSNTLCCKKYSILHSQACVFQPQVDQPSDIRSTVTSFEIGI